MSPPNLLRRAACCALALCLCLPSVLAAGGPMLPADYHPPFPDVAENHWFYPYVAALSSQGLISGYEDGRFGPNDATTTGAVLVMILKAAGLTAIQSPEDGHFAASYASHALAQSWLTQQEVSQLDGEMSRLLVARLAAQALGLSPSLSPSPFADVTDGYVTTLYEKKMLSGERKDGQLLFSPSSSITRSEISAIVWQVQEYATHIHYSTYSLDILPDVPKNTYDPAGFSLADGRMSYTAPDVDTAHGIDVSAYQKDIDWGKVKADGIEFAILRVGGRGYGSGLIYADTHFAKNIEGATQAGLHVGVYFFSQAITEEEAREEAAYVLEQVKGYTLAYPIVFDWENISKEPARTDLLDAETLTAAANAFCQVVEEAGYQPMIYFNLYIGYLLYHLDGIAQYPFWLAQYRPYPGFYYAFEMWQYSSTGTVDGINGNVDMNLHIIPR